MPLIDTDGIAYIADPDQTESIGSLHCLLRLVFSKTWENNGTCSHILMDLRKATLGYCRIRNFRMTFISRIWFPNSSRVPEFASEYSVY